MDLVRSKISPAGIPVIFSCCPTDRVESIKSSDATTVVDVSSIGGLNDIILQMRTTQDVITNSCDRGKAIVSN
jgi:hypothetical protein